MDWLHENAAAVEEAVFWGVSSLLDLEVDLLFFDTTSTYFELDKADEPVLRDDRGVRVPDADDGAGVVGPATGDVDQPADQPVDQAAEEPIDAAATSTSTSTATDATDATDAGQRRAGFRTWGKSKDSRGDLPRSSSGWP